MSSDKIPLTNSAMKMYRRCPKEYDYRYAQSIVPNCEEREALDFGSLVHEGMEAYLMDRDVLAAVNAYLDKLTHVESEKALDMEARALAMLQAFAEKYPRNSGGFKVVDCEVEFHGLPLINPETGAKSRTFTNSGKLDALLEREDAAMLWLGEHKTASRVDENYFAKLAMDTQINRYADTVRQMYGKPVEGVLYNVLGKCGLKRKKGEDKATFEERIWKAREQAGRKPYQPKKNETPEEFEAREEARRQKAEDKIRDEGQRQPETWEAFQERLHQWYRDNPDAIQQRQIILTKESIRECKVVEWQTAIRIREDKAAKCFPKNPDSCERYGRMCPYFAICSGPREAEQEIIERDYKTKEANEELSQNGNNSTANGPISGDIQPDAMDDTHSRPERSGEEYVHI